MIEADTYPHIREDLKRLPGCVVIKHADRYTSDIPDLEAMWNGHTNWAEIKLLTGKKSLKEVCDRPGQILFAHRLAGACAGRSWILVYDQPQKRVQVWQPGILFGHLWPGVAGPGVNELGATPVELDSEYYLSLQVQRCGVVSVPWSYSVFRSLITSHEEPE